MQSKSVNTVEAGGEVRQPREEWPPVRRRFAPDGEAHEPPENGARDAGAREYADEFVRGVERRPRAAVGGQPRGEKRVVLARVIAQQPGQIDGRVIDRRGAEVDDT